MQEKVYRKNKSVLALDAEFLEQMNAYSDEEKGDGEVAMDRIMEYRYNKGVREGEARGEARGEDLLSALINKLIEANRMVELQEITSNKELREKLYKEYGIK